LNSSNVSVTDRRAFAGFPSTGEPAFSADGGNGSTPRPGAGSIATVTTAAPSPAIFCAINPPNECPTTAGLRSSRPIDPHLTGGLNCPD